MKFRFDRSLALICLVLSLVTACVYWPMTRYGFVSYDDPYHVLYNHFVNSGLSWQGLSWAMRSTYATNWQPLTWLSHMLDCSLFGTNAGGHHLTSLLLHVANSCFLFVLLYRLTGARWRSVLVAALFAWHPLHVESVAWISERKDVLSAFFFLLTLWTYVRYTEAAQNWKLQNSNTSPSQSPPALPFYILSVVFFACGLMSKPMLVTTPFVLLLLDFWPLGRFADLSPTLSFPARPGATEAGQTITRNPPQRTPSGFTSHVSRLFSLFLEKLPFLILSFASSTITFFAQKNGGAVASLGSLPLWTRLANAAVSYLRYLEKTLWPANLSICYPYPSHWPTPVVTMAVLVITAGCLWACLRMRRQPWVFTGWFWFLGMLVPVVGVVQVGAQSMADRYTYLPGIGLFLALVWGANDLACWLARARLEPIPPDKPGVLPRLKTRLVDPLLALGSLVALAACLVCTSRQLKYWRNGETLFRHALQVTTDNAPAYDGLGVALSDLGRKDQALAAFREAARLQPESAEVQFNLGNTLLETGHPEESLPHFQASLRIEPDNVRVLVSYGSALFALGRLDDARAQFARAALLDPDNPQAHYNLGTVLLTESQVKEAVGELATAVRLDPGYAAQAVKLAPNDSILRYNLGTILLMESRTDDAATMLAAAVRLNPAFHEARRNLAVALMKQGKPTEAIEQFAEAARLNPDDAGIHFELGQALLGQNRAADAAAQFNQCLRLKPDDARAHYQLATAYAAQQRFSEAYASAQKAHELALSAGLSALAAQADAAMKQYSR